jgi:hypothetical protein
MWLNLHRSTLLRLDVRHIWERIDDLPAKKKGLGSKFMQEFEKQKFDFGHANDTQFEVPLIMPNAKSSQYYDPEESNIMPCSPSIFGTKYAKTRPCFALLPPTSRVSMTAASLIVPAAYSVYEEATNGLGSWMHGS